MRMTGARDLRAEWAAVYGAAYVAEMRAREGRCDCIDTDAERDEIAVYAARVADEAVKALHRVRGSEGA